MSLDIVSFIPPRDQIEAARLEQVEARLVSLIEGQYPDIDTSLNSVFRDIILTPLVYVVAGFEQAAACVLNDLDLSNIIAGKICDCDFAESYLRTLGVSPISEVPSIATVRLSYNTDTTKYVQNTTRFVFADSAILKPFTVKASDITVLPTTASTSQPEQNIYNLVAHPNGSFFVDIPVYGSNAVTLETAGAVATTDSPDQTLISVTLVSPLIPFSAPDSLQKMAERAQKTFPSAALTTRSSAISFFINKLTNLSGVSPVMAGDLEMTRGGNNLFGIQQTAIDLYPKGLSRVRSARVLLKLAKSGNRWVGAIKTGHTPLRLRHFLALDGTTVLPTEIYGASKDPTRFPGLSGAFSTNEELGVEFSDTEYGLYIQSGKLGREYTDFEVSNTGVGGNGVVHLNGKFEGSVFYAGATSRLQVTRKTGEDRFILTNIDTREACEFEVQDIMGGVWYPVITTENEVFFERWLNGVQLQFIDIVPGEDFKADFTLSADEGYVELEYDFDPMVSEAQHLVSQEAFQSAFDTAVLAPRPCVVSRLSVEYRTNYGRWVDSNQIIGNLIEYADGAVYPNVFEDSGISDIVLYGGAKGVRKINKTGILYSTLATKYAPDRLDPVVSSTPPLVAGVDYQSEEEVDLSAPLTNLVLDNSSVHSFLGTRNIQYLLDRENITLIEARN